VVTTTHEPHDIVRYHHDVIHTSLPQHFARESCIGCTETMMLLIGPPPNASAQTRAIAASVNFGWGERADALPFGKEALKRLGGVEKVVEKKESGLGDFDETKIVIPVGITPQTLKNYTLYDMLGLAGDLGGSANTEVSSGLTQQRQDNQWLGILSTHPWRVCNPSILRP
jgi:hypothetical protein